MWKSRFSRRNRRRSKTSAFANYQQLEKREVLTTLTVQPSVEGPTDTAGNPLATLYLNPDTKILYIHARIQNPNLPGFVSDVLVSPEGSDGDIVVNQIAGSAGLFRDVPGISAASLLVNTRHFAAGSIDRIIYKGTEGNDRFQNRTQIDSRIAGLGGDDYLVGGGGQDRVIGGAGNDQLFGGRNDDVLHGGAGDDSLVEDRVNDTGNDRLIGGHGDDQLAGGVGDDYLMGGEGDDVIGRAIGRAIGQIDDLGVVEPGNDRLIGNGGDDTIYGGDGSDAIFGGGGNDQLYGGSSAVGDNSSFEQGVEDRIAGGGGNDTIVAGNGALIAFGGAGDDHITGSAGNDRLIGHAGDDVLLGLSLIHI